MKQPSIVGRGDPDPATPSDTEPQTPTADIPLSRQPAVQTEAPGGIAGTIIFHGKPPVATIDTSMDPACSLGGGKARLPVEQFVVKGGKLANVFLYIKSGPAEAMQGGTVPPQPVVLDQKGCDYSPHVIGVMAGGTVEFRNSDPTMHNIHTTADTPVNPAVDISQPPMGGTTQKVFGHPELMIPVRCNNHPWMNAFINVAPSPFYAVSDESGRFEIRGLPPGTYTLVADHEMLGQQTLQVTVESKQTAAAIFTYGNGSGQTP